MPVRSLTSSVLRWPDREGVRRAITGWAAQMRSRAGVTRVGCFGSFVQGRWGVGSDVDLLVIVETSTEPMYRRPLLFDTSTLPVAADLLVYTEAEWKRLTKEGRKPLGPVEWIDVADAAGVATP